MVTLDLVEHVAAAPSVDLMALLGRCLGSMPMVERVLSMFARTGKADLDALRRAVEQADFATICELTHRMKGASGNVSALRLRDLLSRAETLAQERNGDELTLVLNELDAEWNEFERYARAFCTSSAAVAPKATKPSMELSHAGAGR